jgi:hypothetical protein
MARFAPDALVLVLFNGTAGHGALVKVRPEAMTMERRQALAVTLSAIALDLVQGPRT